MIHDAKTQSSLCVDHLTSIEKFGASTCSNKLRKKNRAAIIREEPHLRKILPEARFFRRNSNVCRQCNVHACPSGGAVHSRDHRLVHGAHFEDRLHTRAQQWLQFLRFMAAPAFSDQAEVPPPPKSLTPPVNHHPPTRLSFTDTPH